jgi:cytochrome P450 family 628
VSHVYSIAFAFSSRPISCQSFTPSALSDYSNLIVSKVGYLLSTIDKKSSISPIQDLSNWINRFTWDIMGEIAFGKDFGMIENGDPNGFIPLMQTTQRIFGIIGHIPQIGTAIKLTSLYFKN